MRFLGFLSLSGLVLLAGCVDDNSSIFVSHVSIFEFEDGQGCTSSIDARLGRARYNVAFTDNTYIMPAVIASQLIRRDVATTAEPNGVHIQYAEVQIIGETGQALTPEYTVLPSSGVYIPPSPVGDIARAVVSFPIIPAPVTSLLHDLVNAEGAQTVVARIRVFARTTGGTEIRSARFDYGIELENRPDDAVCFTQSIVEEFGILTCYSGQDGLPYLVYGCGI